MFEKLSAGALAIGVVAVVFFCRRERSAVSYRRRAGEKDRVTATRLSYKGEWRGKLGVAMTILFVGGAVLHCRHFIVLRMNAYLLSIIMWYHSCRDAPPFFRNNSDTMISIEAQKSEAGELRAAWGRSSLVF